MAYRTVLIIGECGVGKTWVMKQMIIALSADRTGKIGTFYYHRNEEVMILGKYDGSTFEGSDRLSMGIMGDLDKFQAHLQEHDLIVLAEGDRFTNKRFIKETGATVWKIGGNGDDGRAKRGSNQSERHLKSIKTRVSNIKADHEFKNSAECFKLPHSRLVKM